MENTQPLEAVKGSWDVEVKWVEGVAPERIAEIEQGFITQISGEFNNAAAMAWEIPAEIVSIRFTKVQ